MTLQSAAPSFFFLLVLFVPSLLMLEAWVPAATPRVPRTVSVSKRTLLFQSSEQEGNDDIVDRTSFDQAGRSLIEEEDQKRMEQMGDFDSNPAVRNVHREGRACHVLAVPISPLARSTKPTVSKR